MDDRKRLASEIAVSCHEQYAECVWGRESDHHHDSLWEEPVGSTAETADRVERILYDGEYSAVEMSP